MSLRNPVIASIELPWPVATWVLSMHAYSLMVPLGLCVAVGVNWEYLTATTYNPLLFYIAAGLLCAGMAFEVAQNAVDRWYLTSETASANGISFSDMLFYWLITAGQALCAIAMAGDIWWVVAIAVGAFVVFPFFYIRQVAQFAPVSIASLLTTCIAYVKFGDPIIFLQLLLSAVTIYFFTILLKTGAQVIHGFTTLSASSGVWFLAWALSNGANGVANSWRFVLITMLAVLLAGLVLWPRLIKLNASPRIIRDPQKQAAPT